MKIGNKQALVFLLIALTVSCVSAKERKEMETAQSALSQKHKLSYDKREHFIKVLDEGNKEAFELFFKAHLGRPDMIGTYGIFVRIIESKYSDQKKNDMLSTFLRHSYYSIDKRSIVDMLAKYVNTNKDNGKSGSQCHTDVIRKTLKWVNSGKQSIGGCTSKQYNLHQELALRLCHKSMRYVAEYCPQEVFGTIDKFEFALNNWRSSKWREDALKTSNAFAKTLDAIESNLELACTWRQDDRCVKYKNKSRSLKTTFVGMKEREVNKASYERMKCEFHPIINVVSRLTTNSYELGSYEYDFRSGRVHSYQDASAILITKETVFSSPGVIRVDMHVVSRGYKSVPLKNGFSKKVQIMEESPICGKLYKEMYSH